ARASEPRRTATGAAYSPLYQQIKALLLQSLDQGEWKPGEAIPSEVDLAARFQVSQGTVRKAIDELAAENLLLRRQGKGTFVATHHEAKVRFRFLRLAPDNPEAPVTSGSRILDCRRVRSPADIAALLQLRTGDIVVNLRRVLSFENVPTIPDEILLPGRVFEGQTGSTLASNKGPHKALYETEIGVSIKLVEETNRAVSATHEHAW